VGAATILLPIKSLVQAMMLSQTLNGVLLPVILIVMLRLINDTRLMGPIRQRAGFQCLGFMLQWWRLLC